MGRALALLAAGGMISMLVALSLCAADADAPRLVNLTPSKADRAQQLLDERPSLAPPLVLLGLALADGFLAGVVTLAQSEGRRSVRENLQAPLAASGLGQGELPHNDATAAIFAGSAALLAGVGLVTLVYVLWKQGEVDRELAQLGL